MTHLVPMHQGTMTAASKSNTDVHSTKRKLYAITRSPPSVLHLDVDIVVGDTAEVRKEECYSTSTPSTAGQARARQAHTALQQLHVVGSLFPLWTHNKVVGHNQIS